LKKVSYVSVLVLVLLILSVTTSLPIKVSAKLELLVHNIDTGLDYAAIQEAIDASETLDGHIIHVDAGTYYENVVVDKSVSLIGENKSMTVIDGKGSGDVVHVSANNVTIGGFTIRNSGSAANFGICIYSSSGNNITDNILIDNGWLGILVYNSSYNFIVGNTVTCNFRGMWLDDSSCNSLKNNVLVDNNYNFRVMGSKLSDFINDIDASNTVQGKPVCYWVDRHEEQVPSDAGYVALVNSTGISVKNLNLTNNWDGVLLAYTNNSLIQDVTATNNYYDGVYLRAFCNNNTIIGNTITDNPYGIILRDSCNNNTIVRNTVANNNCGIRLDESEDNTLYHNHFVGNTLQTYSMGLGNVWDNGYPSGGNYWSDYAGVDLHGGPYHNETGSDGIGDTPYFIEANNTDNYPLMGMFSDFNATSQYQVTTISNSTISDFEFDQMDNLIRFNVSGEDGTKGFCRICIPTALMNDSYAVFVNGTEVPHALLPCSTSRYSYLYFTYSHSTQHVIIIPEFPSILILPLFIVMALLALVISRIKPIEKVNSEVFEFSPFCSRSVLNFNIERKEA